MLFIHNFSFRSITGFLYDIFEASINVNSVEESPSMISDFHFTDAVFALLKGI